MPLIHPTAIIEDGAQIAPDVRVGPFSIVESGAEIGPGCVIESNVRIYGRTRMGSHNTVYHGATIGSIPQDLSYTAERGKPLTIGDRNQFRECVNISHGIKSDHGTVIGNDNYLMAFSHVGHDCVVGDHNILANTATLAGHVEMGNRIFLSGQVGIHQFCRIGDYAMVSGVSGVSQDVPPYAMVNGQKAHYVGLNVVGLRRAGFDQATRTAIKRAYRILMRSGLSLSNALEQVRAGADRDEVHAIIAFFEASKRGVVTVD